jgi:hypothetical protein
MILPGSIARVFDARGSNDSGYTVRNYEVKKSQLFTAFSFA